MFLLDEKKLFIMFLFSQVKHIEKGINPPSINEIYFSGENLLKGFRIGIVAGMIALTVGPFQSYHFLLCIQYISNGHAG